MDAMQEKRNSYEHFSADEEDAAHYVRRHSSNFSTFYRNLLALLIFMALSSYGVLYYSGVLRLIANNSASPPIHKVTQTTVSPAPAQTSQRPQPLADCIGPDNVIDEAVATCRFGQFPRATQNHEAQGMVSDRFMAQYMADQQAPQAGRASVESVEWATVNQWDKKRTYRAVWSITDNRIEGSSVCTNWPRGSIEYRECRKGAKVYFREQCKSWSRQWDRSHAGSSKAAQQRYCSAGEGFNPLG
ncbi:hypothetical protein Q1J52_14590 [Pseudomonas lijiangensis]|uniref:Transmembrane protein n=2 Tax=Pseudomonas TaxID=286 RepID=A0A3M4VKP2_PSECI|nr:hypothetical protein [Pseudomonas sp. Irchel 3A18]RMR52163.1 hypothetical protein ALP84_00359 [Pseudomonas cichorii]GFM66472.1 hypothetical protein PSCICJ_25900 [Pseudomonas cichorii]GFM78483.1 hypothetical protein PSCICM_43020 [Pseudomonas cichorii]